MRSVCIALLMSVIATAWPVSASTDFRPLAVYEDVGKTFVSIAPNRPTTIDTHVSYFSRNDEAKNVMVTQELRAATAPLSNINIDLVTDTRTISTNTQWTYSQTVTGLAEGVFYLRTRAVIEGTNEEASTTRTIIIETKDPDFKLGNPGDKEGSIKAGTAKMVTFQVSVKSEDQFTPLAVTIEGDINGTLNDEGIDGDTTAGNSFYAGQIMVDATDLAPDTCLQYRAKGVRGNIEKVTDYRKLCVSSFARWTGRPDTDQIEYIQAQGGPLVVSDEVIVKFIEGTPDARMKAIVQSVGGYGLNYNGLGRLHIVLDRKYASFAELEALMATLRAEPDIDYAAPNFKYHLEEDSPFDWD